MIIENGNWTVYCHINKTNGKKYIGITSQKPINRWGKNGNGYSSQMFFRAIQKYGWDNFDHEIIASNLTEEEASHFEAILIKEFDTLNPEKGYNIREGGSTGYTLSEEARARMSEVHRAENLSPETRQKMSENHADFRGEKHPMYGKHHSAEAKAKLSAANLGKTMSLESRAKISVAISGEKNPFYGHKHTEESKRKNAEAHQGKTLSEETRQKLSEAMKGRTFSEESKMKMRIGRSGRPIACYKGDELVCVYFGMNEASRQTGVPQANISKCCLGSRKSAGGYIWRYADTEEADVI